MNDPNRRHSIAPARPDVLHRTSKEEQRGAAAAAATASLPGLQIATPLIIELGDVAATLRVYRLIQYDLASAPLGSRATALNNRAAAFLLFLGPTSSAASPQPSISPTTSLSTALNQRATAFLPFLRRRRFGRRLEKI